MKLVVTTGAMRRAKLQSNRRHKQTNTQFFYRPDALPVAQQCQSVGDQDNYCYSREWCPETVRPSESRDTGTAEY